ncbi:DUF6414 family protein [Aneurinibacillus uraniidurans]|uniref:DUF6414 family protein n=1 Tax=Aneurinibacillus uraniidurans TaxID=2966586 RepID=UPI002349F488|nr:hypothetical protein [Aneurinibacillus sp. B1]WCN36478.1 hypothetical protein PO771_11345 [Aneurinibacillus sp. B1]
MNIRSDYPITIYLNQKIVFDLLAVIQDGFSEVRKLETGHNTENKLTADISGEIGASNIFSLLGVKLRSALTSNRISADKEVVTEERIHTPTSLFAKLQSFLDEKNVIRSVNSYYELSKLNTGDFVSFKATLKQNPLINLLDSFEQLGVMAIRFEEGGSKQKKKSEDQTILKQIKTMKESLLGQGEMMDLVCLISDESHIQAVIPVYMDYFFNRNMNELIDGQYTVFGKVVSIIPKNSDEAINLLRNTSFKLFNQNTLEQMFSQMESGIPEEFDIPTISTRVEGPAMLIIPIAIYA